MTKDDIVFLTRADGETVPVRAGKKTAPGVKASESKHSATTGTRDVIIRNLPEGMYQLLREVSFRTRADYAVVVTAALSARSESLDELVLDYVGSHA